MRDWFESLHRHACRSVGANEVLLSNFAGEISHFVRFNHGRVRQAMTVRQATLELTLVHGQVRSSLALTVSGRSAHDQALVDGAIRSLRDDLATLPADPYLLYAQEPAHSVRETSGQLPQADQAVDDIVAAAQGTDLVGLLASGPVYRGFANSMGASHWHAVESFVFDWSLYHRSDKAVKGAWSGHDWDRGDLARRLDASRVDLQHLTLPAKTLEPGEYRAYLAPAAMEDLVGMLNWDGISAKAQRTRQSVIQRLVDGQQALSPLVSLTEDTANGLAPAFDQMGFTKPGRVELIRQGAHCGSMISPRTAAEYSLEGNGADESEDGQSLSLAAGQLAPEQALQALDTGLAIGNLHYLNHSDRSSARITGMTRFATFWVEGGRVVAPVNVMRWDDSLFRLLGSQLEGLTSQPQWLMSTSTYEQRSVQTMRVPGALVSAMSFTL